MAFFVRDSPRFNLAEIHIINIPVQRYRLMKNEGAESGINWTVRINCLVGKFLKYATLKVPKIENFFGSEFEFYTISLLVMLKY